MATVYILCGKIASGKTTYANKLKLNSNSVILSHDDLMLKLYDNCLGSKHDETVMRISNYFYELAEQLISLNINVIFDFGYWTKAERSFVKDYFSNKGINLEIHYLKTDDSKRLSWLEERNKKLANSKSRVYIINKDLCKRLDEKFQEPNDNEVDLIISN